MQDAIATGVGFIAQLNWPAMTMPFAVTDKALLEGLRVNDVVRFELRDEQTITALTVQRTEDR
jgi:Cu/Ag efflux protein CusF